MKIRYKQQKFQEEAAKAVVDVFKGQPKLTKSYMIDRGREPIQQSLTEEDDFTGYRNHKLIISDKQILRNLREVQIANNIKPSDELKKTLNCYNLTIEMETGVGKTYTYIKTIHELHKAYGWSKFIIVVPSVAIREGVYKSFKMTQDHFADEYGEKIRFFIYDSKRLDEVSHFASSDKINVMIINAQAFNATGKDARRIGIELDEFNSRKPIDVIAKTNPILIIDEPQSVEGKQTKEQLKKFNPLLMLRYSATHRIDSIYNMVYRLDAIDAYNKNLVKKIEVKGFKKVGSTATDSFIYFEDINLSDDAYPTIKLRIETKTKNGIKEKSYTLKENDNLYDKSGNLEEYKNQFVIKKIDGRDNSVEFLNGTRLTLDQDNIVGNVNDDQLRRIQIRETILSHIQKEQQLFRKGIKVLSLFFIDEVAKYRKYYDGKPMNGDYATMFEEEYNNIIHNFQHNIDDEKYINYLESIETSKTHEGYFSIDKKNGTMINGKIKKEGSDDVSAYDLIMKNKERLLDLNPQLSPVRFIFSHSALREGWDNPNVFQICTLKQSSSDIRKRQEVGRGLRLCVNNNGERMDMDSLNGDVHDVNLLTIIASESYDEFSKKLQKEIAEDVSDRPSLINSDLFINKTIKDVSGNEIVIDKELANSIYHNLILNGYVDEKQVLTPKYHEDKANGEVKFSETISNYRNAIIAILDSVYDETSTKSMVENARRNNIEQTKNKKKEEMAEFKELWSRINSKSIYCVKFDTNELIRETISSLNSKLRVSSSFFLVESGTMGQITSKEALLSGENFKKENIKDDDKFDVTPNNNVKYDLITKLANETRLTRKTIIDILKGLRKSVFEQFKKAPEQFIIEASKLIKNKIASTVIEHIIYNKINDRYDVKEIFITPNLKGILDKNAIRTKKHLYNYVVYDSATEREFAEHLEVSQDVAVYVKLPKTFYIPTPVGKYTPDWAIAFYKDNVKHIYFIAETKGTMDDMQLRYDEDAKIECAKEHFKVVSDGDVSFDKVDSYQKLLELIKM